MFVDSLWYGEYSGANLSTDALGVTPRKVTTKGFYNSGTFSMALAGIQVLLTDGVAASTFANNITWTGFPASYAGTVFEQNRSASGTTLNFNNFSAITVSGAGKFINNSGTAALTIGGSNIGLSGVLSACTTGGSLTSGQSCP